MDIEIVFEKEIKILKRKNPNINEQDIVDELENSINIFRSLKQDFYIKSFTDYEKNWIKRCASELLARPIEERNLQSYSENGYSYSYYQTIISSDLKKEIFPNARGIG